MGALRTSVRRPRATNAPRALAMVREMTPHFFHYQGLLCVERTNPVVDHRLEFEDGLREKMRGNH